MQTIYELITLDVQNEHDLEHDLEHRSPFSKPKIYDADGDLTKRWYVYFSYVDPKTGKLKRMIYMEKLKEQIFDRFHKINSRHVNCQNTIPYFNLA